eukprot:2081371-Rhodomonas_salina.1
MRVDGVERREEEEGGGFNVLCKKRGEGICLRRLLRHVLYCRRLCCYATFCTDLCCAAATRRLLRDVPYCYMLCSYARCGADIDDAMRLCCDQAYAVCGTDIGYAATRRGDSELRLPPSLSW